MWVWFGNPEVGVWEMGSRRIPDWNDRRFLLSL